MKLLLWENAKRRPSGWQTCNNAATVLMRPQGIQWVYDSQVDDYLSLYDQVFRNVKDFGAKGILTQYPMLASTAVLTINR